METTASVEAGAEVSGAGFEAAPSVEFTARVESVACDDAEAVGVGAAVDGVDGSCCCS